MFVCDGVLLYVYVVFVGLCERHSLIICCERERARERKEKESVYVWVCSVYKSSRIYLEKV